MLVATYGKTNAFNIKIYDMSGGGFYATINDGNTQIWQRRNNTGGFDTRLFVSSFNSWVLDRFTTYSYDQDKKILLLSGASNTFHGVTFTRQESYTFVDDYIVENTLTIKTDIDGGSVNFSNVSYLQATPHAIWDIDNTSFGYGNSDTPFGFGHQLVSGGPVYGQIADSRYNLGGPNRQKRASPNIGGMIGIGCIWVPRSDAGQQPLTGSINNRTVNLTQWFFKSNPTLHEFNLNSQLTVATAKGFTGSDWDKICQVTSYLNKILADNLKDLIIIPSYNYLNGHYMRDGWWQSLLIPDAQEAFLMGQFESIGQLGNGQITSRISNTGVAGAVHQDDSTLLFLIRKYYDQKRRGISLSDTTGALALGYINTIVVGNQYQANNSDAGHTKTWMDGYIYGAGTYNGYNQGLYCVALKCAKQLGLNVLQADINAAIAQYQALYDTNLGFVKFTSDKTYLSPDVLTGEALSLFLFKESMLSDIAVINTIKKIRSVALTGQGAKIVCDSNGNYLSTALFASGNEQGYYQNGASWFLYEYLAYYAALGHRYESARDYIEERITKEIDNDDNFSKEFSGTKVGGSFFPSEQAFRHGYSWNTASFLIKNIIHIPKVWKIKSKIIEQLDDVPILLPDGQQILVGSQGQDVLLYTEGFNNWKIKDKIQLSEF